MANINSTICDSLEQTLEAIQNQLNILADKHGAVATTIITMGADGSCIRLSNSDADKLPSVAPWDGYEIN